MKLLKAVKHIVNTSVAYAMPASSTPVTLLAQSSKFERGAIAAMSISTQKALLKAANTALKLGLVDAAKAQLALWKKERASYNILINLGV